MRGLRSVGDRRSLIRPYAIALLVVLAVGGYFAHPFRSGADSVSVYPTLCSGDWLSPQLVEGEPASDRMFASYFELTESSARPASSDSRMFCSFAAGVLDFERTLERVVLTMHFVEPQIPTPIITPLGGDEDAAEDSDQYSPVATSSHRGTTTLEVPVGAESSSEDAATVDAVPEEHASTTPGDESHDRSDTAATSDPVSLYDSVRRLLATTAHAQESDEATSHDDAVPDVLGMIESESATATEERTDEATSTAAVPATGNVIERSGVVRVSYTTDGALWHELGAVDPSSGDVSFELPITDPVAIQTLVVRILADGTFAAPVHLEGMRLAVSYEAREAAVGAESDRLIGVAPEYVPLPDLDAFVLPRVVGDGQLFAAVLSRIESRALYVMHAQGEEARIIAHAADMALDTPLELKDGLIYWVGRDHRVFAFDPQDDAYFARILVQSTTIPGALQARFSRARHTVELHDGRVIFRSDAGEIVRSDDDRAARDRFLASYFAADDETRIGFIDAPRSASILAHAVEAASSSDTESPAMEQAAAVVRAVERFFAKAFYSPEDAQHSCEATPFSADVSGAGSAVIALRLMIEPERAYVLEPAELPDGISFDFGEGRTSQRVEPNRSTSIELTVRAQPQSRRGNFTVPIFFTTEEEPHISTTCRINIVNL